MERRLKDYNGYQVWKCTDENNDTFYMLCDQDDNCVNVYNTLEELKKDNRRA